MGSLPPAFLPFLGLDCGNKGVCPAPCSPTGSGLGREPGQVLGPLGRA